MKIIDSLKKWFKEWEIRRHQRKVLKLQKPSFFQSLFDFLKYKQEKKYELSVVRAQNPNTSENEVPEEDRSRRRIPWWVFALPIIIGGIVLFGILSKPSKKKAEVRVSQEELAQFAPQVFIEETRLHEPGDKISIGPQGCVYSRTAGWTYWEATNDHIIYVVRSASGKEKERYFFGPTGWETEKPDSKEEIKTPPPILEYFLLPNKAYGCKEATLHIPKITRQS